MFVIRRKCSGQCEVIEEKTRYRQEEHKRSDRSKIQQSNIVARNRNQQILQEIATNINNGVPQVLCYDSTVESLQSGGIICTELERMTTIVNNENSSGAIQKPQEASAGESLEKDNCDVEYSGSPGREPVVVASNINGEKHSYDGNVPRESVIVTESLEMNNNDVVSLECLDSSCIEPLETEIRLALYPYTVGFEDVNTSLGHIFAAKLGAETEDQESRTTTVFETQESSDGTNDLIKILGDDVTLGPNKDTVPPKVAIANDSDDDVSNSDISELDELQDYMVNCEVGCNTTENCVPSTVDNDRSVEPVRFSAGEKPHSSSFEISTLASPLESLEVHHQNNHLTDQVDNTSFSLIDTLRKDYDPTYTESEDNADAEVDDSRDNSQNLTKLSQHSPLSDSNRVACGARDDSEMFVVPSGKRRKKNFCLYCKTEQSVISRHLETKHRHEKDVQKFAVLKKGNPERRKIIETLRFRGNHFFNTNNLYNDGELKVSRQPNERMGKTAGSFTVCHSCLGWFAKTSIRHHRQRCIGESSKHHRSYAVASRRIAGRVHHLANTQLQDVILPVLREDDISRLIRYDELLILFANKLSLKYPKQAQHDMIRSRLRLLGRFLRTLKSLDPKIDCFTALYHAKYYDTAVRAINIEAEYDDKTHEYRAPSVASTLGNYIKKVGKHLIIECIKREDYVMKKNVEYFLTVHDEEFSVKVNKLAVEITNKNNRMRQKPLPSMEDISALRKHLAEQWRLYYGQLESKYSFESWINLLQVTLISVQLFNRRRAGEIERTAIDDFNNYEKIDEDKDKAVLESLSKYDQTRAKKYVRFQILGKRGRNVPVLLSNDLFNGINLLMKYRPSAKIHPKNPFVFGIPGYDRGRYKHLRACILMRKFANECGAENPERLRGTALRKHVATKCAERNINENDIGDIANFMGHAEKIHRENYRRPVMRRDVCGISKVLEDAVGLPGDTDDSIPRSSAHQQHSRLSDSSDEGSSTRKSSALMKVTQMSRKQKPSTTTVYEDEDIERNSKRSKVTSSIKPKVRWSEEEKYVTLRAFNSHIKRSKLPSTIELRELLRKNPCLKRTENQIRTWVCNQIPKKKSN